MKQTALRELSADAINWDLPAAPVDTSLPLTGSDVVLDLVLDAQAYRLVAQEALHTCHRLTQQLDRLREQHIALRAEYLDLRARVLREDCAA